MNWLDKLSERSTRGLAQQTSRRGWLAGIGTVLAGAASVPLLPMARASSGGQPKQEDVPDTGDPLSCDYWRHCSIDGFLCGCCGGSHNTCPPGTEMSPITWVGTCRNPVDGKNYVISYNDCCGKTPCGQCFCNTNQGDRPMYRPDKNNDINWCLGTESTVYHCSTSVLIGLAVE
jgi:methylamine dehydrogenase light chain